MSILFYLHISRLFFWQMMIAIAVLAAGTSSRMGTSKQLLPLGGKTMVYQTASVACQANIGEVIVVTGANANQVREAVSGLPVRTVYNPNWRDGQAGSVVAAISALGQDTKAVIFLPADQPLVTTQLLRQLVALYRTSEAAAAAPVFAGRRSSPVLFDLTRWRQQLIALTGDQGGRILLRDFPDEVALLEVDDASLLLDADCLVEYEQVVTLWNRRAKCE